MGMYSRKAWGGDVDPFILVKFKVDTKKDEPKPTGVVSMVIFEWRDNELIGIYPTPDSLQVRATVSRDPVRMLTLI
jgi:hypothetical protein